MNRGYYSMHWVINDNILMQNKYGTHDDVLMCFKLFLNYFCQSLVSKGNSTKKPTKFCYVGKKYLLNK